MSGLIQTFIKRIVYDGHSDHACKPQIAKVLLIVCLTGLKFKRILGLIGTGIEVLAGMAKL